MAQLRNHPRMAWHSFTNWPPQWRGPHGPETPAPIGELGVLRRVQMIGPDQLGPARLEMNVEYRGHEFMGLVFCDDPAFLRLLHEQLRGWVGRSVQDIGSLDVSF